VDKQQAPTIDGTVMSVRATRGEDGHHPQARAHLPRHPGRNTGASVLNDVDLAVRELDDYLDAGGGTVIDCTSIEIGRDPQGLVKLSERTGLNIVMGTSHYRHPYLDREWFDRHDTGWIAQGLIDDIIVGVEASGRHHRRDRNRTTLDHHGGRRDRFARRRGRTAPRESLSRLTLRAGRSACRSWICSRKSTLTQPRGHRALRHGA
jgi:hypothetical protein